jgi:hypothetical protein
MDFYALGQADAFAKYGGFLGDYFKHTALNAGQAARDARYMFDHPDARPGLSSAMKRLPSLAKNLWYSAIPPQWHHTKEDLKAMGAASAKEWFLHGYNPWDHPDPIAHLNTHLPPEKR